MAVGLIPNWAVNIALRLSAAFRHFSQAVMRNRSWLPEEFQTKFKTGNTEDEANASHAEDTQETESDDEAADLEAAEIDELVKKQKTLKWQSEFMTSLEEEFCNPDSFMDSLSDPRWTSQKITGKSDAEVAQVTPHQASGNDSASASQPDRALADDKANQCSAVVPADDKAGQSSAVVPADDKATQCSAVVPADDKAMECSAVVPADGKASDENGSGSAAVGDQTLPLQSPYQDPNVTYPRSIEGPKQDINRTPGGPYKGDWFPFEIQSCSC